MKIGNKKALFLLIEVIAIGAWIFPAVMNKNYFCDWYNHKWMFEYYGEYFKSNFCFPEVYNTINHSVGNVATQYYGSFLYAMVALFYILLGSGRKALFVSAIVILMLQSIVWKRVFSIHISVGGG